MNIHVVGGFLGSGKTTAIINALKTLLKAGQRVGVITNDKGRYLVDSAFFGSADIPVAEVPGGCFRCNYSDFQDRITQLQKQVQPDVLFAESVGSCVDLVGPVLAPLAALSNLGKIRVTYSVFVDIRLLHRRIAGMPMPFNDHIIYIFDKQLEEANILVVNKADLMPEEKHLIMEQVTRRFPDKVVLVQSSLTPEGVTPWLEVLCSSQPLPPPLNIDYGPYIAGAAELAWFDDKLTFATPEGQERTVVSGVITSILDGLRRSGQPLAHLKVFIQDAKTSTKLSFTTLDEPDWEHAIPEKLHGFITLIINARVQMHAERLHALMTHALRETLNIAGIVYQSSGATVLAPQVPNK